MLLKMRLKISSKAFKTAYLTNASTWYRIIKLEIFSSTKYSDIPSNVYEQSITNERREKTKGKNEEAILE